ncbi:crotonase/enoyl-CoA hydratase family protein [Sneathiella limimaris]|uniref:crotonase/enoyl-CoA hydratase family protein n=1 Tax=Sneathiella limimaris TaxID=1964213 RepID=UPI00146F6152|nr:crotonase/enoyl-CoA hydratase family protein [Sneathiella limimaris]
MKKDIVLYETTGRIARITLNRPETYNAIHMDTPRAIREAIEKANADDSIHVVILEGAGKAFCSGYDLKLYAETEGTNPGVQEMPWDPTVDYKMMMSNTQDFMSIFRSYKPVIAKVQGYAVAGGSDIALCADLVVMEETAKIGYPPARMWGCPTTAMWVYRLGPEKAKRMLLTGDLVTGKEAKEMGLVIDAVPEDKLEDRVLELAKRIGSVPKNQLMMQKLMINQALDNMGLASTQMTATIFDGITRHSPEGMWFKERAENVGFQQAVKERDSGQDLG